MISKSYHSSGNTPVLYIAPSSFVGGAETFLLHTARYHDRARFQPIYLLFRDGPLAEGLRARGAEVRIAPVPPRLSRPARAAQAVKWIRGEIRATGAQLVHSTLAYGALFGAPAARAEHVPHVWFQHGPVTGWMDRLAGLLPARAIFVNSRYTESRQRKLLGMAGRLLERGRPYELITLGVEWDEAGPSDGARARWGLSEGDVVFGMLCRIQPQKGVEQFIRAMARARRNTGRREIRGVVIGAASETGGFQEHETEMRKLAEREDSGVEFFPPTRAPLEAIQGMDAVVCASSMPEGYGLTLVEAMAMGRVPVGPREGGPAEIIENGRTGLLFAPRSVEDLARVIAELAEKPERRAELGAAAQAHAAAKLRAETSIRALESVYDRILSTSSRAMTGQENRSS